MLKTHEGGNDSPCRDLSLLHLRKDIGKAWRTSPSLVTLSNFCAQDPKDAQPTSEVWAINHELDRSHAAIRRDLDHAVHKEADQMANIIKLPWGNTELCVPLPASWRVLGELVPKKSTPAGPGACRKALLNPIDSERLGVRNLQGKKILLVIDDHSRPTPVDSFLHEVLDELAEGGASQENIRALIATGVHRAIRPDELEKKLGKDNMTRLLCHCHDAYDKSGLATLGTTSRGTKVVLNRLLLESDLIVCIGSIEPHLLLGFGGGLKTIIPGCAGAETIGKNHLQGVDPDHFDAVGVKGDTSPMRLDLEEGAQMLGKEFFIINVAMNEMAQPTRFFCGHPIRAHRMGEIFVEQTACLEVPAPSDVVLTNSYPMEFDLRQSVKCLGNTLYACKPNGVMMACVKSEFGLGEMPLPRKTLPYSVMRTLLKIIGKKRVLPFVKKVKEGQPVEEIFIGHFGLQMLRRNHLALFSDSSHLPEDIGGKMGLAKSFKRVDDLVEWTRSHAPSKATVWVFPYGGSTYARISNST